MDGSKSSFIDRERIGNVLAESRPDGDAVRRTIDKALELKGLGPEEAALLLNAEEPELEAELLAAAGKVKELIYGRRLVLFAPLYIGNRCSNDCTYCAFRASNRDLARRDLSLDEVELEVRALLREGHKRLLVLAGEDASETDEVTAARWVEAIRRIYSVREPLPRGVGEASIRRVNVEIAPLGVEGFRLLKTANIGTYACFQETYDPQLYKDFHPRGPKADFVWRLEVMDRAMEAGIEDVGIGALFGLGDFRFEVLGMLEHARHLEARFGCGPHTVSVPRIEPAPGAPDAMAVPHAVSDREFRRIVATLRLALPYTGIIMSTREREELRDELFRYGVSQISAGSRTNPGAYSEDGAKAVEAGSQFQLGDHRSLEEVVTKLAEMGYVPSFCTGCYRKGRVGADFMDLAKPGLIKRFCEPNALFTFAEYVKDFAGPAMAGPAASLKASLLATLPDEETRKRSIEALARVEAGERDIYF
ncbi:MAG TPA: [FeFe] hydrogenase H-cluster radical SAM maturase HydG [Rectinemataceae bacterium]|nr:[FeFe] hydrogenase H-cluster radical SAM maturase HydG [Rectinemataceae bacterium]